MDPSRRALLISGGAMALAPAGGLLGPGSRPLVPDLLRNPAYDTTAADASSSAASRQRRRPSERNRRCRRSSTTSSGAPSTSSGTPATRSTGWCRTATRRSSPCQHRRRRLRADRVRDRRRPRLRHARRRRASARSPPCASSATRRRGRSARGMAGHKGFFYHFLDMKTGARAWRQRALDRRHRAAARPACSMRRPTSIATHAGRGRDPRRADDDLLARRLAVGAGARRR